HGGPAKWIVGEILQSLATTKNVEKTFKSLFGKSVEDLSKEWHRKIRENHWPEVAGREISEDFTLKLTDHRKLENYLNVTPSFNPTGDRIAFLTDRNGYKEIMLMSAIDGKLIDTIVKGEKAGDYEEMHWMRGGITWSPDGKMIAYATKAGAKDVIHITSVSSGGYNKVIKPDMDAIYSPDWSPDGRKILFCGIKDSKLDLFTVDIETLTYERITDDYFDESNPRWSRDGKNIVFSSDRLAPPYEYSIKQMDGFYNIFIMDADGSNIRQITTNMYNDSNPFWSPDGEKIVFTSDRNGISNLYYVDLTDMTVSPLMNLLTGASAPCWSPDGNKIAFASFKEGGWDIYLLKRPLKRNITFESITPTTYRKETLRQITDSGDDEKEKIILNDDGSGQEIIIRDKEQKPYTLKFSPDMFNAFASYNTFYGLGGMGQLTLSDIMGNHRLFLGANLLYSIEESDGFISYFNLKRQTNYGISAFHYKTYYRSYIDRYILSDRIYGGSLMASRPFNKFKRQDFSFNLLNIERDVYRTTYSSFYNQPQLLYGHEKLEGISTATIETQFINDTSIWGHIGPINGNRYKINIEHAPEIPLSDISFTTVEIDYRKYYRFGIKYDIVTRFSGGASFGKDPRLFFLGGTSNWLNAQYSRLPGHLEYMEDMFFARYPFPFRGFKYYEEYGQRYFLTNLEFRFPFIDYIALNWPIPLAIGNINGVLFTDIGSAWYKPYLDTNTGEILYDKSFNAGSTSTGTFALDDIKMSWGLGVRMNLGFAILRFDTAWRTNLDKQEPRPIFYLSLGPDF
ncbi:BamA/TamA family outer membrane protein, partial [Candidatus Latescibacterota bacterium]